MEYNTARPHLSMKEYGRHIQKMVDYLLTIEDKEKRQEQAGVLIELMGFLNPHLKNVEDFRHKLWDHLFFMSDFKLQVDSPYPIPEKETYKEKPAPLPYPKRNPKYAHLGKNIEVFIQKALQETDKDKVNRYANAIAYYMKLTYSNWHNELVQDAAIQSELSHLSGGKLYFDNTPEVKMKEARSNSGRSGKGRSRQGGYAAKQNGNGAQKRNGNTGSKGNNYGRSSSNGGKSGGFKKKY